MHPVQPSGGNLAAGESVVIELDPNEIRCGIFRFDPDVFAPTVADGAEFANEIVVLAVKKGDDGSFGRADKNHARSVFYFLTSHEKQRKRLGRAGLFGLVAFWLLPTIFSWQHFCHGAKKPLKNPAAVALGRLGGLKGRSAILLVRQTAQP